MTNRDYFRAWDKFDVEKEIEELDAEDEAAAIKAKEAREGAKAREEKNRRRREKEMNDLRDKLNFDNMSTKERKWMSQREKNKGNECFRSGENEDALLFYSRAIALDDSNAVIYANRAMANIRLNNFDAAVSDCTMSLNIDPTYTKALSRRGMVHHRCGRYRLAEDDFGLCLKREPENQEFKALLQRSTQKRKEVDGEATHQKTKKKVMIQEVSDSDESSEEEEEEEEAEEEILEIGADGFDISAAPKPKPKAPKPAKTKKAKKFISEERFIASKTFTGPKPGMVFKKGDDGIMGYYRDGPDPKPAKSEVEKVVKPAFKKIAIVESDSDESDSDEEEPTVTTSTQLKEQGNLAMAKSSYKEAIKLYTESIALDAKNFASLNNRALAYLKTKEYELAFTDADAALKIDPTNVKAQFRRGLAGKEQSLSSSSLSTAKADFEKVVKMEPDNTAALKELKSVEDKLALLSMVEDDEGNEPALMVDPNSSQSSSNASSKDNSPMGFTNITEEEVEEAKANSPSADLSKTKKKIQIEEESDSDEDEQEEKNAAPLAAKKKIVIEESDEDSDEEDNVAAAEALKNEGNKLLSAGKFADAVKKYDAAFALDAKNVAAINNKTLALLKQSKFTEAGAAADQVLALEPDNVKGIFRKACAIVGNGESSGVDKLKEAMTLFERSNKLGGGGGKSCKEKEACAKILTSLEKTLKNNELRNMASNAVGKGGASPAASKSAIEKRVDDAMKKLNSPEGKSIVGAKSFGVPKTTSEMETAVRSLKADASGESVTSYLASFKPATFKKCFTSSMDPDLLSHVFQGLSKTWNGDCSDRNTKIVNQLAKVAKNLDIVFMVLDDKAKAAVVDILKKAGSDKVTASFWKKSFKTAL